MVMNICLNKGGEQDLDLCKSQGLGVVFPKDLEGTFLPSQFLLYEVSKTPSFGDIFMLSINPYLIAHLSLFFPR